MDFENSLKVDAYRSTAMPEFGILVRAGTDPKTVVPKEYLKLFGRLQSQGRRELGYKKAGDQEALSDLHEKGYHAIVTSRETKGMQPPPRR
jgi:hypothetical protein